jgi:hypothetical protein
MQRSIVIKAPLSKQAKVSNPQGRMEGIMKKESSCNNKQWLMNDNEETRMLLVWKLLMRRDIKLEYLHQIP